MLKITLICFTLTEWQTEYNYVIDWKMLKKQKKKRNQIWFIEYRIDDMRDLFTIHCGKMNRKTTTYSNIYINIYRITFVSYVYFICVQHTWNKWANIVSIRGFTYVFFFVWFKLQHRLNGGMIFFVLITVQLDYWRKERMSVPMVCVCVLIVYILNIKCKLAFKTKLFNRI